MELNKWWQWVIVSLLFLSSFVEGNSSHTYNHKSLEAILRKNVNNIQNPKTGIFYNISLGPNYTGMKITVVRLRSISFWLRGLNHSFLNVPSRIVPQPNRMRMAIIFENFGYITSDRDYKVPNYTMIAPVVGFLAYTSSEKTFIENEKINFVNQGKPITIHFSDHVGLHARNNTPICVMFRDDGGKAEFKNMTMPYVCEANSPGHYTLVIPYSKEVQPITNNIHSITKRFNIWWILGFVIGFVGLVLFVLIIVALVKAAERRKLRTMEKNSEKGEAFDTFWIGETKLPLATMIRTQPVLEN